MRKRTDQPAISAVPSGTDDDDFDMDVFDDFPAASPAPAGDAASESLNRDSSIINEKEFKKALDRFYTQSQNVNMPDFDIGERTEPQSEFEMMLETVGVQLRIDSSNITSTYIADRLTHATFVKKLDKFLGEKEERKKRFLRLFEEDVVKDDEKAKLYMSPSISETGHMDTLFRALLLCKHAQAQVFEVLMKKAQYFAKDAEGDKTLNNRFAMACISQIRYLDVIYDPKPLFNSIFDREIEEWRSVARDSLIQAIPEILPNVTVQQDAAENLSEMFLKDVQDNSHSYRISILRSLEVLRTDVEMSIKIRGLLIRNVMKVEPNVLPALVRYCLCSVQKDEKNAFKNILYGLEANLHIEKLKAPRLASSKKFVNTVITEIFEVISTKAKFIGNRFWKEANVMLRSEKNVDDLVDVDSEATDSGGVKTFSLFDVMLCFGLMDAENCDRGIHAAFKNQLTLRRHRIEEFEELILTALSFSEFSKRFLRSLLAFSELLIWSPVSYFIHCGAFILEKLFITLESDREKIINQILLHLNDVETETSAMLSILQNIVEKHVDLLLPFGSLLYDSLKVLPYFTIENVRRLFHVLVVLQFSSKNCVGSQQQGDFKLHIDKLLSSASVRENIWGVLGMLMQLQAHLRHKTDDDGTREYLIEHTISLLDRRTRENPQVRAVFYTHLARVINDNPRIPISNAMMDWSNKMQTEFREVFFEEREDTTLANRFEDERFARTAYKEWLRLGELVTGCAEEGFRRGKPRIVELIPHFQLLRSFAKLKQRWYGDDTQQANSNHWSQFLFAFEANISMRGVVVETKESEQYTANCNVFCYAIEWIRLLLNNFAECEVASPEMNELLNELMRKKFTLMIECQKSVIFTIKKLGEYTLPCLQNIREKEIVIQGQNAQQKKKMSKKRSAKGKEQAKNSEEEGNNDDEVPGDENEECENNEADKENYELPQDNAEKEAEVSTRKRKSDHFCKVVEISRLLSYFSPFRLIAVVKLLQLFPKKRKQTTFILESLQKIVKAVLPRKEKKPAPWLSNSETPPGDVLIDHGDPKTIWRLIHSILPVLFGVLHSSVNYFKSLHDTSAVHDRSNEDLFIDMTKLMNTSLFIFKDIFKSKELSKPETPQEEVIEGERSRRARFEKRKCVMEKIERAMIDEGASDDTQGDDDAEVAVLNYLIGISPAVPTLDCAIALLDAFSSIEVVPDEQRLQIARFSLSYLRREWTDDDGNPLRGPLLNRSVANILQLYISLRRESKRLLAIQWLLANKLSDLVPEEERRRSKISSLEECKDDEVTKSDEKAHFSCFTRGTFTAVYKVLFRSLNETVKSRLSVNAVQRWSLSDDECFTEWKRATSCFCLLTLMIRIKDLRNSVVLLNAAREGRYFLYSFASKSSFMNLINGEKRFAKYASQANAVFKTVQIGNRSLQNMAVYAKSTKCTALLKLLPELRATSEMFIRVVHSLMVGMDCDEAFQIGLLKSRNIDGEEIRNVEEEVVSDGEHEEHGEDEKGDVNDAEDGGEGAAESAEAEEDNNDGDEDSVALSTASEVY